MKYTLDNDAVRNIVALGKVIDKKAVTEWEKAVIFSPSDGAMEVVAQNHMAELSFTFRKETYREEDTFAVHGYNLVSMLSSIQPDSFSIEPKVNKQGHKYCLLRIGNTTTKLPQIDTTQVIRRDFFPQHEVEAPGDELLQAIISSSKVVDREEVRELFSGIDIFDYDEHLHVAGLSKTCTIVHRLDCPGNLIDIKIPVDAAMAIGAMNVSSMSKVERGENSLRLTSGNARAIVQALGAKCNVMAIEKYILEPLKDAPSIVIPRSLLIEVTRFARSLDTREVAARARDGKIVFVMENLEQQKGSATEFMVDGSLDDIIMNREDIAKATSTIMSEKIELISNLDKIKAVHFRPHGEGRDAVLVASSLIFRQ